MCNHDWNYHTGSDIKDKDNVIILRNCIKCGKLQELFIKWVDAEWC